MTELERPGFDGDRDGNVTKRSQEGRRDASKREELSRRLEQVENLVQVQVSDAQTNNNDIKLINERIDRCKVTEYLGEQVSELGVALEAVAGMFGRTNCSEDKKRVVCPQPEMMAFVLARFPSVQALA